jgi:hypothetical protein
MKPIIRRNGTVWLDGRYIGEVKKDWMGRWTENLTGTRWARRKDAVAYLVVLARPASDER